MEHSEFDLRLAAVEAAVYKDNLHQPKMALQSDIAAVQKTIAEVEAKLRLAESRLLRTSDAAKFATKADLQAMAKTVVEVTGKGGLEAEQVLAAKIDQRIRTTLLALQEDVAAAKSVALTTSQSAADFLRARASFLSN